MHRIAIAALALLAATVVSASAEPLYSATFETESTYGWEIAGNGTVDVTAYMGNHSLHLTGHATATTRIPTQGYTRVTIGVSLAALRLEARDGCFAEYSIDNGEDWNRIIHLGNSQADGVTLYPGKAADVDTTNATVILIRLKALLTAGSAGGCWGDAIFVTGDQKPTP